MVYPLTLLLLIISFVNQHSIVRCDNAKKPANNTVFELSALENLTSCQGLSNRSGLCMNPKECSVRGGTPDGDCSNVVGHVCCSKVVPCGSMSLRDFGHMNPVYLQNELYPDPLDKLSICEIIVEKIGKNVKQLRIEFERLELYRPTMMGQCQQDHFGVYNDLNEPLAPKLCGNNTGQHLYLEFKSENYLILSVITSNVEKERTWSIKLTQLHDKHPELAPKGCLQVFREKRNTPDTQMSSKKYLEPSSHNPYVACLLYEGANTI